MLVIVQLTVYESGPYVDESTANVKPARAGRMMDKKRILSMKSADCLFDPFRLILKYCSIGVFAIERERRGVFTA